MLPLMIHAFGPYELDTDRVELRADGAAIALEPQVFALLRFLIENRDRMVSKDEIVDEVWGGRIVSDSAVASRIKSARQAVGDDGRAQRVQ
jgi:DNA-binding winged helix-turn-helix (wHTH) protein